MKLGNSNENAEHRPRPCPGFDAVGQPENPWRADGRLNTMAEQINQGDDLRCHGIRKAQSREQCDAAHLSLVQQADHAEQGGRITQSMRFHADDGKALAE